MMDECDIQLKDNCESIRNTLEALAFGKYYDTEDGCIVDEIPEDDDSEDRYVDLEGYLNDNLGVKITTDLEGAMYSCEICFASGGPAIYADTSTNAVEGYWWGRRYTASMDTKVSEKIEKIVEYWRGNY